MSAVPEERVDVVVVGSGFGGSICALRLAAAGQRVVVLERGRRYSNGEFPRDPREVDRIFWRFPERASAQGLFDLRFFSGVSALVASGVGGGSLVYANINVRPDAEVFDHPRWPRSISRQSLEPYFEKVAAMLGVGPVPTSHALAKRDAFHDAAKAMNRPVFDPDQAVTWGACRACSQCELGCQYGAKNSADRTYLKEAEARSASVRSGVLVQTVEPVPQSDGQGGYRVRFRTILGALGSIVGARVVLSAGTLGTTEILLRSRDEARTLPNLSDRLGYGYSANGDFLGTIENSKADLSPWSGPDVTSIMKFTDEAPRFTVAAPGLSRGVTSVLASLGQPRLRWLRAIAPLIRPHLGTLVPWLFARGLMDKPLFFHQKNAGDPAHMTNLFAIGQDNANGRLHLRGGKLDLAWDFAGENRALIHKMKEALRRIGEAYGGTFAPLSLWDAFQRILTVHSLGGASMADSREAGVVSPLGEVFGYPGLFVADGSVIPMSLGFHPAMTISAVSERIAEHIVRGLT